MKKIFFFLLLSLLLLPGMIALGEAEDMTEQCTLVFAPASKGKTNLRDGDHLTVYEGRYLEIIAPEGKPCFGLYLCFSGTDTFYSLQRQNAEGGWETFYEDQRGYVNSYLPLEGLSHFRIALQSGEKILLSEIALLGEGEIPSWVQDWKDFEGKADLMVITAHADDEILFFGGTIPYYAAEQGKKVIVCYMTKQTPCRRNELLDGLWLCGVREYPDLGIFPDGKNYSLGDNDAFWGKKKIEQYVTALFRKYQPDVVVTHDVKGEYGHGAHRSTSAAAMKAVELAADGAYAPETGEAWQVKKLYLHLYKENEIIMDWRKPLEAFGGLTAHDVATAAFDCHASQKSNGLIVQDWGQYANNRFGLYFSSVGADIEKQDFFENIP